MSSLGDIIVVLGAETSEFTAKMAEARGELDATEKSTSGLGSTLATGAKLVVGLGAAAVGASALLADMAGNFQSLTTQIVTGAGESVSNLALIRNGILQMAGEVGSTPDDLAKALYNIESAGFHGAAGLEVLRVTAQGAKVGMADQATVADAVTSALNAYHLGASSATSVTNDLIATVAQGKMHMQDLAGALGSVLPAAASAGLSLAQVSGAIATMTMQGTDAKSAAAYLRQTILMLENPSAKAATEMTNLGLSSIDVSKNLGKEGLTGTLNELVSAVESKMGPAGTVLIETLKAGANNQKDWDAALKKMTPTQQTYVAALATMVGGTKSMQAALELTSNGGTTFQKNVDDISAKVAKGGTAVSGWTLIQGTFNEKMDEAKGALESAGISIGTKLLPAFGDIVKVGGDFIDDLLGVKNKAAEADPIAAHLAGTLQAIGKFIADDLMPPLIDFGKTLLQIGEWVYSTFEPPLKDFVQTVGPPLISVFEFLAHNGWAVEAIIAAIAARFVIIKGLQMGQEFLSFANGFEQYAAITGSKAQAIMAALGLGGSGGISGAITGLKTNYGQLADSAATTAEIEGTSAEDAAATTSTSARTAATAQSTSAAEAQAAWEEAYSQILIAGDSAYADLAAASEESAAAQSAAAEDAATAQVASMGTIMGAAGKLSAVLLPLAAIFMAIQSMGQTTGPAFANKFGFNAPHSLGNPFGVSFGTGPPKPATPALSGAESPSALAADLAKYGINVNFANGVQATSNAGGVNSSPGSPASQQATNVWNALATEINKDGPLTQTQVENLLSQAVAASNSATDVSSAIKPLASLMKDKGAQAGVDMIMLQHNLEDAGVSSADVFSGTSWLSARIAKDGPLTAVQMDAFLDNMRNGQASAFDLNLSLQSINNILAPAVPYAQGLANALKAGASMPNAIKIARGGSGGGGFSGASGGLADAPSSGGLAVLHGREYVVPESMASPALRAAMAAAIAGDTIGTAMPSSLAGAALAGGGASGNPSADAIGRAVAEALAPLLTGLMSGNRASARIASSIAGALQTMAQTPMNSPVALR